MLTKNETEWPLTTDELAARWKCRREQIYWLIGNGKIKAFKVGKRALRINPEEIRRFECGSLNIEDIGTSMSSGENESRLGLRIVRKLNRNLKTSSEDRQ